MSGSGTGYYRTSRDRVRIRNLPTPFFIDLQSFGPGFGPDFSRLLPANTRAPIAQLVEYPLQGTGVHGFDPGPGHTKVVKMVLAAPRLALRRTR